MLDVLVFAPHPDDAELGCGGAIAKGTKMGLKIGIIDMTAGEMGTRGNMETRLKEAEKAKEILGVVVRDNMLFPDTFLEVTKENVLSVAKKIREYRPKVILIPNKEDRHPDHVATSEIVTQAWHYAKLKKVSLGLPEHYTPVVIYYELNYQFKNPTFIMDISEVFEIKKNAILAYESQFKAFKEDFYRFPPIRRWQYYGLLIGSQYGEAFLLRNKFKLKNWKPIFENLL